MTIPFEHRQSAHCESGVTANLLRHAGLPISEAMVFGIAAGIIFAYVPFIRVNNLPLITFRIAPGWIFNRATRALGARTVSRKFKNPEAAEVALDERLGRGVPTGLQVSVYWLPFFPPAMRFHFNSHNLVVYGKEGDRYRISDPTIELPVECPAADLKRARFAEGPLAPHGRLYYIEGLKGEPDLKTAIRKGIRKAVGPMIRTPMPISGARGIRFFASRLAKWPQKFGERHAAIHLGHTIRMQEEIGTGGGGFRFVYAAFLQEAAPILGDPRLTELSEEMTRIGDAWRDFARLGARVCKGRSEMQNPYGELAQMLNALADREEKIFRQLAECAR